MPPRVNRKRSALSLGRARKLASRNCAGAIQLGDPKQHRLAEFLVLARWQAGQVCVWRASRSGCLVKSPGY